jgi:hypothetical protein
MEVILLGKPAILRVFPVAVCLCGSEQGQLGGYGKRRIEKEAAKWLREKIRLCIIRAPFSPGGKRALPPRLL